MAMSKVKMKKIGGVRKKDKDDNRWGWGQGQLLMSKVQDEEEEVFQ